MQSIKKDLLFTILTFVFILIPLTTRSFIKNPILCTIINIICIIFAITFFIMSLKYSSKK